MQLARMTNWKLVTHPSERTPRLFGDVLDHPHLGDEENVTTSRLESIDFEHGVAITQNTIYILEDE